MTNQNETLAALLAEWIRTTPWERLPAEGMLLTVDDPWYCYACGATQPYDADAPDWGATPPPDSGEHRPHCLWVRSRAALRGDKGVPMSEQPRLQINATELDDGTVALDIDMSPDVKAHLQHGLMEPIDGCIHCDERERLFRALGLS